MARKRLPFNVEARRFNTQRSSASHCGWDKSGRYYFIHEEDNSHWVARGRDHADYMSAKTLTELGSKLAMHGTKPHGQEISTGQHPETLAKT